MRSQVPALPELEDHVVLPGIQPEVVERQDLRGRSRPADDGPRLEAPVDVEIVTDRAEDVLAVPVAALVALAEGGYAVEVDTGGGTVRLVSIETGFYADGLVEVTSSGLEPGDRVVVP